MYLVNLKTLLTEAVKRTYDADYPVSEFRGLHASIEFPMEKQNYPGVWVDFSPVGPLQVAGIGHREYAEGDQNRARSFTRWRFQGEASFTLVSLSSLERDRLHDEFVRVLAFGRERESTAEFRSYIESNDFLAVNFDFDEVHVRGMANTLGTPWQSDEMVYEVEVAMECFGEFVSDNQTATLVPLSEVRVTPFVLGDPDPTANDGQGDWV